MIIINTKNYKTGDELLKFARLVEKYDVHTILAVPAPDIYKIASKSALNVYAQHVDHAVHETSTGWISARSVKVAGASGALLNHSEHAMPLSMLKEIIEHCKKVGLATIVCTKSVQEAQKIAQYKPHAIAFEDAKLIGTGKSITSYNAREIEKFVAHLKGKPIVPLCGAGISSIKDVQSAYRLGCKGVLIASALAQKKNPELFLEQLAAWQRQL